MNMCPVEGLEILLSSPGVSVGVHSQKGGSVLHVLVRTLSRLYSSSLGQERSF